MKNKFLFLLLLFPWMAQSQDLAFEVAGKLNHPGGGAKVFLHYQSRGSVVLDSAVIHDGHFTFTGQVPFPTKAILSQGATLRAAQRTAGLMLYLEQGKASVNSPDSLDNALVSGTATNVELGGLQAALKNNDQQTKALYKRARDASDSERADSVFREKLCAQNDSLDLERKGIIRQYVGANPHSKVSLDNLEELAGYPPDGWLLDSLFNLLSAELRASVAGTSYAAYIKELQQTSVGSMAPLFKQADTAGREVSLEQFRGQYVLLDFWASWCAPCRAENPHVVAAYHALKNDKFTVLGISLDQPGKKDAWLKAIADDKLVWTQLSDLKFWDNAVAKQYYVKGIPQNFLIDPSGRIVARDLRGRDLTEKIRTYMK